MPHPEIIKLGVHGYIGSNIDEVLTEIRMQLKVPTQKVIKIGAWNNKFFKFHPKALMIETKVKWGLPHLG